MVSHHSEQQIGNDLLVLRDANPWSAIIKDTFMNKTHWNYAEIPQTLLNISATLASGQCFRWQLQDHGEWHGVIGNEFVRIRPHENGFYWQTFPNANNWETLETYFRLDVDLGSLIKMWAIRDVESKECFETNTGIRILKQSPHEALFSFLCASNNSIMKIRKSVSLLAERVGVKVHEFEGKSHYSFPQPEAILSLTEIQLRQDMWGFRAPYVVNMAKFLSNQSGDWLDSLASLSYIDAHCELVKLHGIGAKLADCISLFGLGFDEAVPVDTHIRQIALRKFGPQTGVKSLTANEYKAVASRFQELYGPYAGWAQQYLFYDELNVSTTQNKMAEISRKHREA